MQLVSLTISRAGQVLREIPFKAGLNLILDKPTSSGTDSGNNVGKTTVLRLIDYCLGSDGTDIWTDAEFKTKNQEVFDFLHSAPAIYVTLKMSDPVRGTHSLSRSFKDKAIKKTKEQLYIDDVAQTNLASYRDEVKNILFGTPAPKPTLRQLAPKFVRTTGNGMAKTLRYLHGTTSNIEYEAIHLFLFGFLNVDVLEARGALARQRKVVDRDIQGVERLRKEGEIEQLLLHLRGEIELAQSAIALRGEVPDIARAANAVAEIRGRASAAGAALSRLEGEMASISQAISGLKSDYENIDFLAVKSIYAEAGKYNEKLQHDWEEVSTFVANLRGRKERFLHTQLEDLSAAAIEARQDLLQLQGQEEQVVAALQQSRAFEDAIRARDELHEKLKQVGGLEESLAAIQSLRKQLDQIDNSIEATRIAIAEGKARLTERVGLFNKFFSALSKELYGEQYLLTFDEQEGTIIFSLTSVGANVGEGKKASQTAAFDIAYIKFLREAGINFPTFVCHDGIEAIHGNQLLALLNTANAMDGQLIVAAIRDKLPDISTDFLKQNTIVELSQDDKLFGL
ncbi:MAG TPA: DUF2326 domain-containing protein [Burkholderiaceae bacterium]